MKLLPMVPLFAVTLASCDTGEVVQESSQVISHFQDPLPKGNEVALCHETGHDGTWLLILVGPNAFDAHVAHGDASPHDPVPGMDGYTFDSECKPIEGGPTCFDLALAVCSDALAIEATLPNSDTGNFSIEVCGSLTRCVSRVATDRPLTTRVVISDCDNGYRSCSYETLEGGVTVQRTLASLCTQEPLASRVWIIDPVRGDQTICNNGF